MIRTYRKRQQQEAAWGEYTTGVKAVGRQHIEFRGQEACQQALAAGSEESPADGEGSLLCFTPGYLLAVAAWYSDPLLGAPPSWGAAQIYIHRNVKWRYAEAGWLAALWFRTYVA